MSSHIGVYISKNLIYKSVILDRCSKCGFDNSSKFNFCGTCGKDLTVFEAVRSDYKGATLWGRGSLGGYKLIDVENETERYLLCASSIYHDGCAHLSEQTLVSNFNFNEYIAYLNELGISDPCFVHVYKYK